MNAYLVRRFGIAANASELDAALTRLRTPEDRPMLRCRSLRSYALREADGRFGLACVVESDSVLSVHEHGWASRLPVDEVVRVVGMRVERPFVPDLLYLIRRRKGWPVPAALDRSAEVARRLCDGDMAGQINWLRTYSVLEDDGSFGTFCLYQAVAPEALREHAARAGMPATEITPVLGRVVFDGDASSEALSPKARTA
jgi:hypothetical protein